MILLLLIIICIVISVIVMCHENKTKNADEQGCQFHLGCKRMMRLFNNQQFFKKFVNRFDFFLFVVLCSDVVMKLEKVLILVE